MSKPTQHGRGTKVVHTSPLRMFYMLLGAIALVGIAGFSVFVFQNQQRAIDAAAASGPVVPLPDGPTGVTPDGLAYKGNAEAAVVVTEYSDFQ